MTGYHLRALVYFILLIGCLIGSLSGASPLLFAFAFFLIAVSQFFYLCPRCGKHVDTKPADQGGVFYLPGEPHAETCPRCRRARNNVWMLQYFLKREPWDGQSHDAQSHDDR